MRKINCPLCMDQGIVPYYEMENGIKYEYIAHCVCQRGHELAYEGKSCERKSNYRRANIQEKMPISEIAKENIDMLIGVYGQEALDNFNKK